MKMMFGLLSDHALNFVSFFEDKAKKGETLVLDTKDVFSRFTADGISTSVLGFEGDCVKNKESYVFKIANSIISDFFGALGAFKTILNTVFPRLYKLLNMQLCSQETTDFIRKVVVDTMNERDRKNISRPDVIQLLLQLKKGQSLNEKENNINDKELANFSANVEYEVGSKTKSVTKFEDADWISQGFIFFGAG